MRRAERVVFALRAFREAGQSASLTERPDAIATASQNFMGIGLVANIPDYSVARSVKNVMQRHRQFDYAKASAEMTAGDRNRADCLFP